MGVKTNTDDDEIVMDHLIIEQNDDNIINIPALNL